jgi:tetratricopeptide (TPR) repeat protein
MALKTFLLVTFVCSDSLLGLQPAMAKDKHHSKQSDSDSNSGSGTASQNLGIDQALGIDHGTQTLVNEGKWQEAATALEAQTAGSKLAGKKEAWLAFAYLYLNNCAKLTGMNDSMGITPSQSAVSNTTSGAPAATSSAIPAAASSVTVTPTSSSTATATATATPNPAPPATSTSTTATTVTGASAAANTATGPATTSATSSTTAAAPTVTWANPYAVVISAFEKVCEGRRDDAFTLIQQLPKGTENDPICVFARAAIASKRGMPMEAANYCQRVMALAPNFAWGYRTLGFLQQFPLKQPAQAEMSYRQALQIQPELSAVRKTLIQMKVARNDFDGAIELAKGAIALHPQDASTHYQLADEIYIKQWRFIEASQQLDDAIKYDAGNAKYYRAQAGVKRLQGDLRGALQAQQMAVKLGADKAFELVELASLEQLNGDSPKAVDYLEQSIALEPDNSLAHEKLISLLESGQRYDELVAEYTRLLKDKPKDAKLHLRLAKALANAGKIEEAEKQFVEAANLDPNDAEPHRQMGLLKIRLRQFGAAAKEYTRALNINPSSVPDLVSLGYCYAENDDYMQAEAAYVTGLALQQLLVQSTDISPDRLDIMRSLAILLMHETRYSDAANQFESIIAMRRPGGDASVDRFMLARAQAMRDLTSESATTLQKAYEQLDEQNRDEQSMWMVDIFLRMKRPEMAHALVEKHAADKADSDADCSWLEAVGRYDFEVNNADAAKIVLTRILDSKVASNALRSRALSTIAEGAYSAGDLAAAEKSVRSAIEKFHGSNSCRPYCAEKQGSKIGERFCQKSARNKSL